MSRPAVYVPTEESPLRRVLLAILPVLIAVIVVGLTPVFDRTTVTSKADQRAVALGLPWPWLKQDQSRLDPSFPIKVGLDAVQESPVTVEWPGLAADLGLVLVAEVVLIGGVLLVRRRRQSDPFG